ncbi:1-phosphofructokinase family hexose kinase [Nocardia carnea]|uniref:1-phosphofructokinase family hexose kinase n=1 Tax=Nocardia carnea TaxID=37328 RepID=UPI002456621A|nr:hexose kinase [Nocardia carnea]
MSADSSSPNEDRPGVGRGAVDGAGTAGHHTVAPARETSRVLTVTLNPTVDICLEVDRLVAEGKNRARVRSVQAGGGGINVARCVRRLGGDATAIYVSGGDTGQRLDHLLDAEGLDHLHISVAGETREAVVVSETGTGRSYHLVPPGPRITGNESARCLNGIRSQSSGCGALVLTGSFPPGVDDDFVLRVVREARAAGTPVFLDIAAEQVRPLRGERAFLVRLDRVEAARLVGHEIASFADARAANALLLESGTARYAVTTVGALGAVLSDDDADHEISAPPLPTPPRSDACAGDSLVAALTDRFVRGHGILYACEFGVAAAAATVLLPGTEVFEPETVDMLRRLVRTRTVPRPPAASRAPDPPLEQNTTRSEPRREIPHHQVTTPVTDAIGAGDRRKESS